jgi:hypothetical protein
MRGRGGSSAALPSLVSFREAAVPSPRGAVAVAAGAGEKDSFAVKSDTRDDNVEAEEDNAVAEVTLSPKEGDEEEEKEEGVDEGEEEEARAIVPLLEPPSPISGLCLNVASGGTPTAGGGAQRFFKESNDVDVRSLYAGVPGIELKSPAKMQAGLSPLMEPQKSLAQRSI